MTYSATTVYEYLRAPGGSKPQSATVTVRALSLDGSPVYVDEAQTTLLDQFELVLPAEVGGYYEITLDAQPRLTPEASVYVIERTIPGVSQAPLVIAVPGDTEREWIRNLIVERPVLLASGSTLLRQLADVADADPAEGNVLAWVDGMWRPETGLAAIPGATTTNPGTIVLSGDLSGTWNNPTAPGKADLDDPRFTGGTTEGLTALLSATWA